MTPEKKKEGDKIEDELEKEEAPNAEEIEIEYNMSEEADEDN